MTAIRRLIVIGALLFCVAAIGAQVDVTTLAPQAGAAAIDFTLTDQAGHPQTLKSVAGPKGTMLVFFRSADW
jgi:hypothetical protein